MYSTSSDFKISFFLSAGVRTNNELNLFLFILNPAAHT